MSKPKFSVKVTFNGAEHEVSYEENAATTSLLEHAKHAFNVQSNHLLSLFTSSGVEIQDRLSIEAAGITAGELLILRQSTVRGGA